MGVKKHREIDHLNTQNNKKTIDKYVNTQKTKYKSGNLQEDKTNLENIIQKIKKGDIIKIEYYNDKKDKIENPILLVRSKIYESEYKAVLGSGGTEITPFGIIKKEKNQFFLKKDKQKHKILSINKM